MADAKKGDSFMRQNRIKKFLTAGLSGAFDTVPQQAAVRRQSFPRL